MKPAPKVTLKNGIIVANFSSPHDFTFDDGSILPACDEERVNALSLKLEEKEIPNPSGKFTDVELTIEVSEEVDKELYMLCGDEVDIIIVPFMVLDAVKQRHERNSKYLRYYKIRVVRMVDRVKKIVSSEKFCI